MINTADKKVLAKLFFSGPLSLFVASNEEVSAMKNDSLASEEGQRLLFVDGDDFTPEEMSAYDAVFFPSKQGRHVDGFQRQVFHYIPNPDGTMRWVYPTSLKQPTFLSFYAVTSLKSRLFVLLFTIAFAFHLQRFISKSFTVYSTLPLPYDKASQDLQMKGYSIFTGTVGKNRKAIIEFHRGRAVKYFLKVPLDIHSAGLINHERAQLVNLEKRAFDAFDYPAIIENPENIEGLIQENVAEKSSKRVTLFDARHANFVAALHARDHMSSTSDSDDFMKDVATSLAQISAKKSIYLSDELSHKLESLKLKLSRHKDVNVALAHGDFVPWNTFAGPDKLHVYDWELARNYYPALFDAFHFVFQTGILIHQHSFEEILKDVNSLIEVPELKAIVTSLNLDVDTQLAFYLLLNTSSYLNLYMDQKHLHKQAYWLLNVWNEALDYVLSSPESQGSDRASFINNTFLFLHEQEMDYAVLKIADKDLFNLAPTSDIDLLFRAEAIDSYIENMSKFSALSHYKVDRKSNLTTLELFFKDNTFLSIDLVTAFKRRSVVYLNATELIKRKVYDERGFFRLSYVDDIDYMLNFYLLNGDYVPTHYQDYFLNLSSADQLELTKYLNTELESDYDNLITIFEQQDEIRSKVAAYTKQRKQNMGTSKIKNLCLYCKDTLKGMTSNRGYIITLSGVDGAGKTTVLDGLKDYIEGTLRRQVVLLRLRPSVLPILSAYVYGKQGAEDRSVARLPRTGTNKSVPKSVLRFMYYQLDYMLGQWVIFFKYQLRGKVVIYDRYYFDFINDPRRMNLEMPQWLSKFGYRCVFKPQLNFFLYAQPEVILARKKELDGETIKALNKSYLSNFEAFSARYNKSKYISIENIVLEETEEIIQRNINAIGK